MAAATLTFPSQTLLKNVVDPVDGTDAATKEYVDNALGSGGGNVGAAGSTTQVQFNNSGKLGASANLTFSGTVLTVVGNVVSTNADLGNLTTSNYFHGIFDATSSSQPNITSLGNLTSLTVEGLTNLSNLHVGGNITGNFIGTTSAPGDNTQIIFNDANTSNATNGLTFDKTANLLTVGGNIVANGGKITLDTGTISVSGDNAGIFNLGISNVSLGLGASNITVGSSGGTVTARGNLVANNILGYSVISNKTGITIADDPSFTLIDEFATAEFRSAKYLIKAGSDGGYQSIEVLLIHDDLDSYITIYGAVCTREDDLDIVTITANINGGNVSLYASGMYANTVVNLLPTYVKD